MNRWLKVLAGIVIFLVLLTVFWTYHTNNMYENSLQSDYDYRVSVDTRSTLHNVTLYLPLPVFENKSPLGEELVSRGSGDLPPEWKLSIMDTEYGPMLNIEAQEIQPPGDYFSFYFSPGHELNTRFPVGNESVLLPKNNLRESDEGPLVSPPSHINPLYYDYESQVYASYDTRPDFEVQISVSLRGSNEWWIYGWTGNSYSDKVTARLIGPQDGWSPAEGLLVTGDGVYRD